MNTKGKVRISFDGDMPDGQASEGNHVFLADAAMHVLEHGNVSILELHIVMPKLEVEGMLNGMQRAGVELWLEGMAQADPD